MVIFKTNTARSYYIVLLYIEKKLFIGVTHNQILRVDDKVYSQVLRNIYYIYFCTENVFLIRYKETSCCALTIGITCHILYLACQYIECVFYENRYYSTQVYVLPGYFCHSFDIQHLRNWNNTANMIWFGFQIWFQLILYDSDIPDAKEIMSCSESDAIIVHRVPLFQMFWVAYISGNWGLFYSYSFWISYI